MILKLVDKILVKTRSRYTFGNQPAFADLNKIDG